MLIPDVHPRDDTVPSYSGNKESTRIVCTAKSVISSQAPPYGTPSGKSDLHFVFFILHSTHYHTHMHNTCMQTHNPVYCMMLS